MKSKLSTRQRLVLAVGAVALLGFWLALISDAKIYPDASQNLRMALNLRTYGVISLSESPPIVPTMQREPLPPAVGALAVRAVDGLLGPASADEYFQGRRAELLKYQNILWLSLLSAAVFLIGWRLGLGFWLSLLCVALANLHLMNDWYRLCMLDSLLTESAAAAFLTIGSLLLMVGVKTGKLRTVALAGLCFGLVALVKAAFLYISLGVAIAIPGLALLMHSSVGAAARQAAVVALVTVLVPLPWMLRNYHNIGSFNIAGRGGEALHDRAVMDQMTRDEHLGSFYVWAPYPLNGPIRRLLGFSRMDLDEGGRMQRLNEDSNSKFAAKDEAAELAGRPQETLTYYRYGRAERVILVKQFVAAGNPQPDIAADLELRKRALAMIKAHPFRHLALSVAFLWRGGNLVFPLLAIAIVYAIRRRNHELVLVALPALALVLFYALFASFETRYAMPTYPIGAFLTVMLAKLLAQRMRAKPIPG
jgi:hypothetical protein